MAAKMTSRVSHSWIACLAAALAMPAAGHALEPKKPDAAKAEAKGDANGNVKAQSDVQQFCVNNAALLGDARIAYQTARLTEIEAQIRQRLAELEAKKGEYEAWLRKRDEVMKQAADGIVAIYAKMRPDAAASQLAAMDDAIAAAILAKLPSRAAGAILGEMEAGRAARLTHAMTGPDAAADEKRS
ncbi:MAG: MotE family protein [Methylocella sp.]